MQEKNHPVPEKRVPHTDFFLYVKKGATFERKLFGNLWGKVWTFCTQKLKKIAPSRFEIFTF